MRAALVAASPDLAAALERGERPPAARRYLRRMAGRPAPFGLLAGISVGSLGERTVLEVDAELAGRPVSLPAGPLVANPTAHVVGDRLHLVDRSRAVRLTPAIRAALDGDRSGPPEFLARLVREGVLVPAAPALEQLDAVREAPALTVDPAPLRRAADVLAALTPARAPAAIALFCDRFVARWGDAEVPLLEALDDEAGIGLPEPPPALDWTARERRMLDVIASGVAEWDVAEEDLGGGRPLPASFAVQAALLDGGSLRVFGVSGPSGLRLIARHGFASPELRAHLRAHAAAEAELDPAADLLEVRWHGAREAPVAARPALREPLVPADLLVRVVDARPVLRSSTTGRRVEPRLDTAHDFRAVRDPVYRFLGLLQDRDGEGWLAWDWGALGSAGRLPRVRHGEFVLWPAQWRHPRVKDLPEWVCVVDDGRELPVPREEAAGAALVREFLPPAGPYVHDLIVPFAEPVAMAEPRAAPAGRIVFKPGGEWSSIKLFCGPAAADAVLAGAVLPLVRGAQWYFLRHDGGGRGGDWHLRVRARGVDLAPLAADPRVYRAELDTYVRETARYGDIEAAERCFHADSEAVAALLGEPCERRHLAIAGVAALFADAGATAAFPGLGPAARRAHDRGAIEAVLARDLFAERSRRWRDDLARVDLASLAHMHVNRVLRSGHRTEEPLVYDYLSRQTALRFSPNARTPSKKSSV